MHALRNCQQGKRTNKTFCLWHLEIVSISISSHSRFCVCVCEFAVFVLVGMRLIRVDSCDLLYVQYDGGGCHCFMSFFSLLEASFSVPLRHALFPKFISSAITFVCAPLFLFNCFSVFSVKCFLVCGYWVAAAARGKGGR